MDHFARFSHRFFVFFRVAAPRRSCGVVTVPLRPPLRPPPRPRRRDNYSKVPLVSGRADVPWCFQVGSRRCSGVTGTSSQAGNRTLCSTAGGVPSVAKKIGKKLLREVFSKFFGHAGAPMHKTKNRGHRNLSVVKFSARCDAWSLKKTKKNANCGNRQNIYENR